MKINPAVNQISKIQNLKFITLVVMIIGGSRWTFMGAIQAAVAPARVTFTKVLEGSIPEFEEIEVDSSGSALYDGRKLSDPPMPRSMALSAATTQRIFGLAHAMNDFKSIDLDYHKKVANMGRKTFTYEQGAEKNQAEFNYSIRRDAQELVEIFEGISTVEEHIKALEYGAKYDPLSLPRELLLIQNELKNKALVEPELMSPVLEQIARNPHLLHLAQVRAQDILQRIR